MLYSEYVCSSRLVLAVGPVLPGKVLDRYISITHSSARRLRKIIYSSVLIENFVHLHYKYLLGFGRELL